MTSTSMSQPNARTFTPVEIVNAVLAGQVRVPSFQRKFRWQFEDVRRLFDSIAKGYPIGNLLLWERKAPREKIRIGTLEMEAPEGTAFYVVDGQQRVTSLASALTQAGMEDPRFAVVFNLHKEDFEKYESTDKSPHLVPLPVIFDLQKLLAWFAKNPEITELLDRATRVTAAIREYAIPAYVVKHDDEKTLRDIFDRINTYGKRLSQADVFSALHGGTAQDGSNLHFSDIAESIDAETRFGKLDDETILKAFLARRGKDVMRDIRAEFTTNSSKGDFATEDATTAYQLGEKALVNAIRFLQEDAGVPHLGFLPYRYLLVVLSRFFGLFPKPSIRNRTLLRRFFWRAVLIGPNAFSGSTSAMRLLTWRIDSESETTSIQQLLNAVDGLQWFTPSLDSVHNNSAGGRIVYCALWSLEPMSPIDGSVYDIETITTTLLDERLATNVVKFFFPRAPTSMRKWGANRAILLGEVDAAADDVSGAFVFGLPRLDSPTQSRVLRSHALDSQMIDLLARNRPDEFLAARQKQLASVLHDFIEKKTEIKFDDSPPLEDLDLDDDDERDDEIRE
jgi:hypothetical protein